MNARGILLTHFSARYPKMPQSEAAPIARPNVDQTSDAVADADGGASSLGEDSAPSAFESASEARILADNAAPSS